MSEPAAADTVSLGAERALARRISLGRLRCFLVGCAALWVPAAVTHSFPKPGWFALVLAVVFIVQYVRHGPPWHYMAFLSGLLAAWLLAVACLFLVPQLTDWLRARSFDAETWRSAERGVSETRVWMVDDLLASHSPVGRPVAEFDELLGPDDGVHGTRFGEGYFDDWDRVWWLGPERGFIRIDSEWLVLRVDASGKVTEAKLVRD